MGVVLIATSILLLASLISYSPGDPNFIYSSESTEIKNITGFYGSVISDFLLQSLGLIAFLIVFNFFYWGLTIITKKKINNFIVKTSFTLIYLILGTSVLSISYSNPFWLIDYGYGGFVGQTIKENIYYFSPLIENQYLIYGLALATFIFFILSLDTKINEIIKIFIFPFILIKKIFAFF